MRRDFVIGAFFFLIFLTLMVAVTLWSGRHGGSSRTTVSVEEGTVEVTNAFDPVDRQVLHSGQQISSSQGKLFGIEAVPTPDLSKISGTISMASQDSLQVRTVVSRPSSPAKTPTPAPLQENPYWIAGYVKSEKGLPLPGTKILLHDLNRTDEGQWFGDEGDEKSAGKSITDERGYYTIQVDGPHSFQISSIPDGDYLTLRDHIVLTEEQKSQVRHFVHPEAPYSIQGVVLDAESGKPIENADVGIFSQNSKESMVCAELVKSGADGTFSVRRLVAGIYRLEAMAEGYIRFDPHEKENNDFLKLDVSAASQGKEYVVKLKPGFAATVIVRDTQQKPVAGVELSFLRNTDLFQYAGWGKTDATGVHKNTQLPKDSLVVKTKKERYGMVVTQPFQPGLQDNPAQIAIVLPPPGSISGRVTDTQEKPVADRRIFAEFRVLEDWKRAFIETAQSGEDGTYTLENLSAGSYRVALSLTDWLPNTEQSKDVELEEGEQKTGIDFTVTESREIRGKTVDRDENPVPNAFVMAVVFQGNNSLGGFGVRTDAKGEFRITNLPDGETVQFNVESENYARLIQTAPMEAEYTVLTLKPNGALCGAISDMRRKWISGARIWPIDSHGGAIENKMVLSGSDGTFRIENINPGFYRFGVSAENYCETQTEPILIEEGKTSDAGLIVLEEGVTISGVVLDPQGTPVPGASIVLQSKVQGGKLPIWSNESERFVNLSQYSIASTGEDGTFQIDNFPSIGETLIVSHDRFAPQIAPITPDMFGQASIVIALNHGGSLEGLALDTQGNPESGSRVLTYWMPGEFFHYATACSADGRFRLDNLMPGVYRVEKRKATEKPVGETDYKEVRVEFGQIARCDFGSDTGTVLRGTVYRNGQAVPNLRLRLSRLSMGNPANAQFLALSDERGLYYFQGLDPGVYQLAADKVEGDSSAGFSKGYKKIFEIGQERQEIQLDVFLCDYEIRVSVLDESTGESIPDVRIQSLVAIHTLQQSAGIGMDNTTGADGHLSIFPDEPGHYEYTAMKEGYFQSRFGVDLEEPTLLSSSISIPVEVRMRKQEKAVLVDLRYNNLPVDSPGSYRFYWIQKGIHFELPFTKEPQSGLYKLTGMNDGPAELKVIVRALRQQLISLPQAVTVESGRDTRIRVDLLDSYQYVITLETPANRAIRPPVYCDILDFPSPVRLGIPVYAFSNRVVIDVPKGPYPVRLLVPGFQPMEFIPDALAEKPGKIEYAPFVRSMTLTLTPE